MKSSPQWVAPARRSTSSVLAISLKRQFETKKLISVAELASLLATHGDDIALLDVREPAEYNLAHIAGSCSLPRRQIELRVERLVPWRGARVVACDDDGVRTALAAQTLEAMGYKDVSVLGGGTNRWVTEGHHTEWGVNVPSKDFAEKVLLQQEVPELEPDQLAGWIAEGRNPILLDSGHRRSTSAPAFPAAARCRVPNSGCAFGTWGRTRKLRSP